MPHARPEPDAPLDAQLDADALAAWLQRSPQAAFDAVRQAAQAGQVPAQLALAQMHMDGKGTPADPHTALMWYAVAASNGSAAAMNMAGRCHELGQGTPVDCGLAAAWYRRSAESGDFRGQANYASILLQHGQVEQAADLLRQALAQGSPAFMAHIVPELAASTHPQIRALVAHLAP